MNALPLVNSSKMSSILTSEEIGNAYDEIKRACISLNSYYIGKTNERDVSTTLKILKKYFNKNNPLIDINAPVPGVGWTPLQMTCWYGLTEEARFLLNNGANPTLSDTGSEPSLHLAVANGYEPICYSIIKDKRELINYKNNSGQTPVMLACETKNKQLLNTLLYFKPDTTIKDLSGKDCLSYAREKGNKDFTAIVSKYILENSLSHKTSGSGTSKKNKI